MTSPSIPTFPLPESRQNTNDKFSHFHQIVRLYYLIVFGFIIMGVLGTLVQAFFSEWLETGKLNFPPFERYFIIQFALHYPLYFYPCAVVFLGLGILGFIYNMRFTRLQKAHQQALIKDTVDQVLEHKGPDMIQNAVEKSIDQETRIREAVKKGIEETGVLKHVVKKGVEEVLKDPEVVSGALKLETITSKLPMDIHVLPLPPATSGLVGRESDQEWIESRLAAGKIVGVSGMGGVGKTTLVADTVNKVASQFNTGGVAVILANDITSHAIILRQLVEKFVPNDQELLSRSDTKLPMLHEALSHILIRHHEKSHRVLIVIDGIEPGLMKDDGLEQLCNIFRSAKASVLMTARERLSARLVHESRELEVFTHQAAFDLLTRLLEGFLQRPLNVSERLDAAGICEIAGNHAQAIVLIAAYIEYHPRISLATYLQQLKGSHKIILDLTDRLRSIEALRGVRLTFASSYSQLEDSAQKLFVALGALTGSSCTYQAIRALGSAIKLNEEDTWASFEALIRSKLVLLPPVDASGVAERIYLHPLVQEFAHELLRTSSDIVEDALYEALVVHYTEWIQDKSEDILTEDDVNLMSALRWAKAHVSQAGAILAQLIYSLRWYWQNQFQIEEAFEWLETGCEVMEHLGAEWHERWGQLMFTLGAQYQWIGRIVDAERCYKKSLSIFRKVSSSGGSKLGLGEAFSGLAALAQQKGEPETAQGHYEKSLAIFRKARDRRGEADVLYRLGFLALRTGDTSSALYYYRDSLNIRLALRTDQWGQSLILYSLGAVYQQIGEIDFAQRHYAECLALCKQTSNRRTESLVLKALGDLALQTSGPADAEKYLTASSNISRAIFDLQSESVELYSMAFLLRQTGKTDDAWNYYSRSLVLRERIKDERGRGYTLIGLGDLSRRTGDMASAKRQLEEGLAIGRRIKDRRSEALALKALGDWAWQAGHMGAARDYYNESLTVCKDCHDLRGEAITLKALGDLDLKGGDKTSARKYFSLSLDLFHQMKDVRGQGATLHSLGILSLDQGDKTAARTHFDQSLDLLRRVQDRPSEAAVLYALADCAGARSDLAQSEKCYRESLQIATEIKAAHYTAVFQETLGDFLLRHYGQKDRQEGNLLLVKAAESYRLIGRIDAAEHVEERRVGRYRVPDRDRIMSSLIYDLDQGPNGQGFAVPHERRSALRPA